MRAFFFQLRTDCQCPAVVLRRATRGTPPNHHHPQPAAGPASTGTGRETVSSVLPALKAARCTCRARGRPRPPPLLLHRSTLRSPLLLASRRRRAFDLAPPPPAKRSVPLFRISVRTRHDAQLTPWLQPELCQSLQRTEADKGILETSTIVILAHPSGERSARKSWSQEIHL